ncbi:Clp protease N-terminal domain-containing protein [Streptomyces longispororuber]|uniref:Clp protease N-terminal domain-containing protein n=1 Tax=Streptomyces longispororuber TaxID=68230 RepID=UPI003700281E
MKRQLFDDYAGALMEAGAREAQQAGSATIEAEHLLLSIAAERDTAAGRALGSAGLDPATIREALRREFRAGLEVAGVSIAERDLPVPQASTAPPSKVGQSAKLALERGVTAVQNKKDLRPGHLLLGILRLEHGTVPRALSVAGVDRGALRRRVEQSLRDDQA